LFNLSLEQIKGDKTVDDHQLIEPNEVKLTSKNILYGSRALNSVVL